MYAEDDLIPLSALQHALFCERQYALIHLEQIWAENRFTAEGRVLHERVDAERHESRKKFRQEYGMRVRSLEWGLIGKCDLVEVFQEDDGKGGRERRARPVEFKRGKQKASNVDRVQLCAQAVCLEEMMGAKIETGQLYYFKEHRRTTVPIDAALREETRALVNRIRDIQSRGVTPHGQYDKRKCDHCSLVDICMPRSAGADKSVERFMRRELGRECGREAGREVGRDA